MSFYIQVMLYNAVFGALVIEVNLCGVSDSIRGNLGYFAPDIIFTII